MKARLGLAIAIVLIWSAAALGQQTPGSLSTEDLIAKLSEESDQGVGSHTTASASAFLAIDDEPRFQGGIIGSKKPAASPVMRELVHRGLAALPVLIEHLTDSRPTKLTVGDGFMGKWFAEEYDPRYPDRKQELSGGNTTNSKRFDRYTLRVGDLCFVATGQIVNRKLNAVRYQPSLCLVINSPVESPALAAAVKRDWGGLTARDHERSLEQDALHPSPFAPGAGLKRLSFYYPQVGDPLIIKMLNRPFYDRTLTYTFFAESLVPAKTEERRANVLAGFRAKHGETNYLGVLNWLLWASNFPESQMSPERWKNKEVADSVLNRVFPGIDPHHPPFRDAVDFSAQGHLMEDLAALRSKEMDEAALQVLRRVALIRPARHREDRFTQCTLASAIVERLIGQEEYHAACRSSLEKLVSALQVGRKLEKKSEEVAQIDRDIEILRKLLRRVPAG